MSQVVNGLLLVITRLHQYGRNRKSFPVHGVCNILGLNIKKVISLLVRLGFQNHCRAEMWRRSIDHLAFKSVTYWPIEK